MRVFHDDATMVGRFRYNGNAAMSAFLACDTGEFATLNLLWSESVCVSYCITASASLPAFCVLIIECYWSANVLKATH